MRRATRVLGSAAVMLAIAMPAADARASAWSLRRAPVEAAPAASEPAADPQAEAQALYEEGLAQYNTFDYENAIATWTRAYGKLPPSEANRVARNALVYNIASAQEKAFEQDKDVVHLVRAKSLLEVYVQENIAAGGADEADLAKARERIAAFDERIREEQARADKRKAPPPKDNAKPKDAPRQKRRGVGLVSGGAALLGLGVATVAGGVTAGVLEGKRASERLAQLGALGDERERRRQLDRGHRGDTIALATAITGGVVAVGAAVMIAIGATRMRKSGRTPPRTAWTPVVGRFFVGVSWNIGF